MESEGGFCEAGGGQVQENSLVKEEFDTGAVSLSDEAICSAQVKGFSEIDEPDKGVTIVTSPAVTLMEDEQSSSALVAKITQMEFEKIQLEKRCLEAQEESNQLRETIKKASANWFQQKSRISDLCEGIESVSISDSGQTLVHGSNICDTPLTLETGANQVVDLRGKQRRHLLSRFTHKCQQLDLVERRCLELTERMQKYDRVIEDQSAIITGLKDQLETFFSDNQKMSQQLRSFAKLFEELEFSQNGGSVSSASAEPGADVSTDVLYEDGFKSVPNSVSTVYIKLKELIYEKKSLVTEIERLKALNVELQRRVLHQETRLLSVSDALHAMWLMVSNMKEQHAQLHSDESVLRYELHEKRQLLHRLKDELECSREQWLRIRQKNTESEQEWLSLREELSERRRLLSSPNNSQDSTEDDGGAVGGNPAPETFVFEPPVDLLLDMGIEYGVVDADDELSLTVVAMMEGQDVHPERLQVLEEQCSFLYQKLMASTSRSLTLASRLSTLHQHFGSSSEGSEDGDEDEETDDEEHFASNNDSPDPESVDTAYVSDGGEAPQPVNSDILDITPTNIIEQDDIIELEEAVEEDLSRRLINFLPKKIDLLKRENRNLVDRCSLLAEERSQSEVNLKEEITKERQQRLLMERKMSQMEGFFANVTTSLHQLLSQANNQTTSQPELLAALLCAVVQFQVEKEELSTGPEPSVGLPHLTEP